MLCELKQIAYNPEVWFLPWFNWTDGALSTLRTADARPLEVSAREEWGAAIVMLRQLPGLEASSVCWHPLKDPMSLRPKVIPNCQLC